jgi:hypothetical protein
MNTYKLWAGTHIKSVNQLLISQSQEKKSKRRRVEMDDEEDAANPFGDADNASASDRQWLRTAPVAKAVLSGISVCSELLHCHFDIEQLLRRHGGRASGLTIGQKHYLCLQSFPDVLAHTVETMFDCSRAAVVDMVPGYESGEIIDRVTATATEAMEHLAQLNAHGNGAYGLAVVVKVLLPCLALKGVTQAAGPEGKAAAFLRVRALEFLRIAKPMHKADQRRIAMLMEQEEKEVRYFIIKL